MALVRNIVIVVISIAFWNRFVRQRTTDDKEKLLQSYDYIIGKYLLSMLHLYTLPMLQTCIIIIKYIAWAFSIFYSWRRLRRESIVRQIDRRWQHTVLLLEAGVDDQTPIGQQVHVPINYVPNFKTDADWEYYTEPQKNGCFAMKDEVRCSCFHIFIIYFPRTKLREGNIFSCFCLSVHRGGPKVRGAHPAGMLPCYLIFWNGNMSILIQWNVFHKTLRILIWKVPSIHFFLLNPKFISFLA